MIPTWIVNSVLMGSLHGVQATPEQLKTLYIMAQVLNEDEFVTTVSKGTCTSGPCATSPQPSPSPGKPAPGAPEKPMLRPPSDAEIANCVKKRLDSMCDTVTVIKLKFVRAVALRLVLIDATPFQKALGAAVARVVGAYLSACEGRSTLGDAQLTAVALRSKALLHSYDNSGGKVIIDKIPGVSGWFKEGGFVYDLSACAGSRTGDFSSTEPASADSKPSYILASSASPSDEYLEDDAGWVAMLAAHKPNSADSSLPTLDSHWLGDKTVA